MTDSISEHIRSNVVGYLALFCFAMAGTAQALPGVDTVDSGDIIDLQVKRPDIAANAVNSQRVAPDSLTAVDLAPAAIQFSELNPAAFAAGDISPQGSPSAFGVSTNAIQSSEISDGAVGGSEIATSAVTQLELATDSVGQDELREVYRHAGATTTVVDADGGDEDWSGATVSALCPAGIALGGYGEWTDASGGSDTAIAEMIVNPTGSPHVVVRGIQNTGGSRTFRAVAICLDN